MRNKSIATLLSFILCIVIISLLTSGGCGIGFGNSNSNGSGGGGGVAATDSVQGTITSITNISSTSGIMVQATDSSTTYTTTTDSSGFFQIQENFIGSSIMLEFLDQSSNLLASISLTIFPSIQIALGSITITNGIATLSNNINVTFSGTISENNCTVNSGSSVSSGTLIVTAGVTNVLVQVITSTSIVNSMQGTLSCADLPSSGIVTVTGTLLMGNTVQATQIVLQ
jgi:hypothetical protein